MKAIGIDGCKAGWFLVAWDGTSPPTFELLPRIQALEARLTDATTVLIDIPIGLRSHEPEERDCDRLARRQLGRRGSSVFPAPSRCVLDCGSYAEANARNRACTGRGLSCQSWNIVPKIAEVDAFLRASALAQRVREMHPELCFLSLNGGQAMQHNKKTAPGFAERLALLTRFCSGTERMVEQALASYPRKHVARDDVLDALVGAVTAALPGELERLPPHPDRDEHGLAMEIVYRRAGSR